MSAAWPTISLGCRRLGLGQPLLDDIDREDASTIGGEPQGNRPADAGPGTRDQRHLSVETIAHGANSCWVVCWTTDRGRDRYNTTSISRGPV